MWNLLGRRAALGPVAPARPSVSAVHATAEPTATGSPTLWSTVLTATQHPSRTPPLAANDEATARLAAALALSSARPRASTAKGDAPPLTSDESEALACFLRTQTAALRAEARAAGAVVVAKPSATGLARTVECHPDGAFSVRLRQHLGRGGFKRVRRIARVELDEHGEASVKTGAKLSLKWTNTFDAGDVEHRNFQRTAGLPQVLSCIAARTAYSQRRRAPKHVFYTDEYDADVPRALAALPALSAANRRALMVDCATAVAALHGRGLVHHDLKPDQFLVRSAEGESSLRAVLGDLGSVAHVDEALGLLRGLMVSLRYVSPDRARRLLRAFTDPTARHARPSDDLWALGVVLHLIRTGREPAALGCGEWLLPRRALLREVRDGHAPVDDVDACIAALLDPDPTARPSAQEVVARLRHHADGSTSQDS
jgi:hypothetical protein